MTTRTDPITGNITGGSGGGGGGGYYVLSSAMLSLAHTFHGSLLAAAIQRCHERDGQWFPSSAIGSSHCHDIVAKGQALGLWKANATKPYYHHTPYTMRWVREALEWQRSHPEPERAEGSAGD